VGALLTVPGNGGHYSAVATGFAGALQVWQHGIKPYIQSDWVKMKTP